MIVELQTALWPAPIVIDTSAPSSGGGALAVLKPSVRVRVTRGEPPIASWEPAGSPDGSVLGLLVLAGLATILVLAYAGATR